MPRKKKQYDDGIMEPEFMFDDLTILQSDGNYDQASALMLQDLNLPTWCLSTNVTINHSFGSCRFELELHSDKNVIVLDAILSSSDPLSNMDVRCLKAWCVINGWNDPQPSEAEAMINYSFWHHMWSVRMVDSPYYDRRYGERDALQNEVDDDEFIYDDEQL